MINRFDHVTVVVKDVDQAKAFLALLGFEEDNRSSSRAGSSPTTWASRVSRRST